MELSLLFFTPPVITKKTMSVPDAMREQLRDLRVSVIELKKSSRVSLLAQF
jgi:hypothetical protein